MDILNELIERGFGYDVIDNEELVSVYYRRKNIFVNRNGTIVLFPFTKFNKKWRYAVYKGNVYISRKILVDDKNQVFVTSMFTHKRTCFRVDRIVLMAFGHFVRNEESQCWIVKHKDGNQLNCCIDNLEWQTKSDYCTKLQIRKKGYCRKQQAKQRRNKMIRISNRIKTNNLSTLNRRMKMNEKYTIDYHDCIDITKDDVTYHLYRIIDKDGNYGGRVGGYYNLSQKGDCWIESGCFVYGNARVCDDAKVCDYAKVYGNAKVCGNAKMCNILK